MSLSIRSVPSGFTPKDGPALLFFVMDGCPHCTRIKSVMNKVASCLGSVVPAYKVDASSSLTRKFGVSGFPTIIYVDNRGTGKVYNGQRTFDGLTSFVCHESANRNSICQKCPGR